MYTDKKISRRGILKAGLTAAAIGVTSLAARPAKAAGKSLTLRMQTHWSTGSEYYQKTYVNFAKRVEEASNGELKIKPLPPGTVVPTTSVLEATGRGTLDLGFLYPAYWIGQIPVAGHLNGQLATWDNFEEMWFFMNEMGALDIIREAYAEHGLFSLGPVSCGVLTLWTKKPIVKPGDFKGVKVRSTGIPAKVFQKLGATPVFFPGEELYQALQTGVCDAAHWGSVYGGWEMKLQEVTNYIIQPNLANQTNVEIFINKKVWDGLPKDLQRILLDCTLAASADNNALFRYNDFLDIELFKKEYKGKISNLDPEAVSLMRKYSLEVIDEYSKMDPKYCGKVGLLMHKFLEITGKI